MVTQVPVELPGEAAIPVELNEFSAVGAGHSGGDIGTDRIDHYNLAGQIRTNGLETTGEVALLVAREDGDGEIKSHST